MIVYREVEGKGDFEFWSGAIETVDKLTDEEFETVIEMLDGTASNGMSETELNDFFWFETDTISSWIGRNIDEDEEDEEDAF